MDKRIFGLLGRSLQHSYSVRIHRELGTDGYRLIELEPEELRAFLKRDDIGGLNVTIPYKREVIPLCDELDDTARAIGAVNTLVRGADGKLCGYNTDAYGLCRLAQRAGVRFAGRKVVIFGSGGASLTAAHVARAGGAREVVTVSRHGTEHYGNLNRHADAHILINATPVGMYPDTDALIADPAAFPDCGNVLDLIYNPARTALLLRAEELKIPCANGLPMLVAQAKAAEELFTDRAVPDAEIDRVLALMRRDMRNIVLIGMPGSGKTTVGRALAALSGKRAVDLDEEIAGIAGCPISELFANRGEEAFRKMEREQARKWGAQSGLVLITGGGIVKDMCNLASLRRNGRVYEVERDTGLLAREGRPLSFGADLEAMYRRRKPLYQRFRDAAVKNEADAGDAARAVWEDYCENSRH